MDVQSAINAGLFVEYVYENWNSQSSATDLDGRAVVTAAGAPVVAGKNYNVLKTIYSNDLATDISPEKPALEGYKTMGIIAQNAADATDVVIAIRGTEGIMEWVQDAEFVLVPCPFLAEAGNTEDGAPLSACRKSPQSSFAAAPPSRSAE